MYGKFPVVTIMGLLNLPPNNCPFSFNVHHRHLIHPSLNRPHTPSQTASRSTQPFFHNILSRQTDRQTDRLIDTHTDRTLAILIESDALIIRRHWPMTDWNVYWRDKSWGGVPRLNVLSSTAAYHVCGRPKLTNRAATQTACYRRALCHASYPHQWRRLRGDRGRTVPSKKLGGGQRRYYPPIFRKCNYKLTH